jgi:hypothetical protein
VQVIILPAVRNAEIAEGARSAPLSDSIGFLDTTPGRMESWTSNEGRHSGGTP